MTAPPVAATAVEAPGSGDWPAAVLAEAQWLRVREREPLADAVVGLRLERPDGQALTSWEPGAHIDLLLEPGLARQYSLCGDPAETGSWQIAVQQPPDGGRGGSRWIHRHLQPGDQVLIRGPRNAFRLRPSARYTFIAGGIGITPILPMIARADAAGADWQLVYGGRSRAAMPFLAELSRYGSRVRSLPQDEAGLPPIAALLADPDPETLVYGCGPQPMLDAIEAAMAGWPQQSLVMERFTPAPASAPAPAVPADSEFEVELAGSGRVISVPAGQSVLETLEQAGMPVLSSCREGTCGTCEVGVLGGLVDHRDQLLTEPERAAGDTMLVCVSRSRSPRLVLDL